MSLDSSAFVAAAAAAVIVLAVAVALLRSSLSRRRSTSDTYADALEALANGRARQAMTLLRDVVEADTDHVKAYLLLGRLFRERGDTDRATRIHQELRSRPLDTGMRRRVLREVLEDHMTAGRWADAKSVALELRRIGGDERVVLRALGRIHEELREWGDALSTFEALEKRQETPSDRRIALYRAFVARDYQRRGKLKEARKHYESALKVEPGLVGALLYLGDVFEADGDHAKAIDTWTTLVKRNPGAAVLVLERMEHATYKLDPARITKLTAFYEQILDESPGDVSTMRALANLHRRRGDVDEALAVLTAADERVPSDATIGLERAELLWQTGRRDEAFEVVRGLLSTTKSRAQEDFRCAKCGYESGDYLWRCPSCSHWESFDEAVS